MREANTSPFVSLRLGIFTQETELDLFAGVSEAVHR
jgi:hypothetical protein